MGSTARDVSFDHLVLSYDAEDHEVIDPPADAESFDPECVAGFSDEDYPTWLQAQMDRVIPREILQKFGSSELTFLNGDYGVRQLSLVSHPWDSVGHLGQVPLATSTDAVGLSTARATRSCGHHDLPLPLRTLDHGEIAAWLALLVAFGSRQGEMSDAWWRHRVRRPQGARNGNLAAPPAEMNPRRLIRSPRRPRRAADPLCRGQAPLQS